MTSANRRGFALLEVIAGMTILVIAAAAVVALAEQSINAARHARAAERDQASAERFLEAVALWPRDDLDRHLGTTTQGEWLLVIGRSDSLVFDIVLADSPSGKVRLNTAVYRPLNVLGSDG